jgi:AAA15 family ATPase/GTPase
MSENDMSMSSSTNLSGIDGLSYEFSVTSDHKTKNYNAKLINHDAGVDISHVETYKETLHGIYVSPNPFEIAQRFGKMVTEKKKNSLIEILNKIEPKIIDLELGENGIIYCDVGLDRLIPLNAMGDGIVKIVSIITSMFYCENGVVFIDEIENGFHYKSLKILWKGVLEAAKELNIQVFASTHSIECIIALNEVSNEIEDKLKVYRFEKNDGNYSVAEYSKKILATTLERKWELR